MSELAALQGRFMRWLLQGDPELAADVADDGRLPLQTRLEVYRNAYGLRLAEALADSYPAVHTLLGDARFDALARSYIEAHPSTYRSIRWFGDRLAAYLAERAPWCEQPILAEMAAFEWALRDAFDAADAAPLARADLAALPPQAWAGLRLDFHPSVQRLDLQWNTVQLWQAIDDGREPVAPERGPYPVGWVIWRRELRTWFRSLEVDEAWALDRMRAGAPFAEVCAGLVEWIDEAYVPERAAALMARWLIDGKVIGAHA